MAGPEGSASESFAATVTIARTITIRVELRRAFAVLLLDRESINPSHLLAVLSASEGKPFSHCLLKHCRL